MAEALGVAGSIVSFIGLAGQVAQGVNYLYNFFDSVQDAPSDIRSLAGELKILSDILDDIHRDGDDSASLGAALQRCKDVIGDLESLVRKSKLTSEQSKARKVWSQMSTAFRNEKFRKHIEKLEEAKSTLLHAKLQSHRKLHQKQLSEIKSIHESLNKASSEHSELIKKSTETAKSTQTELQTLPSRVKDVVVNELSSTMAKPHATCSTILTEVKASSIKADQASEEIKLAIQSLLSDPGTSRIAALLQPALEKVIADQIASSMENLQVHQALPQKYVPTRKPEPDGHPRTNALPGSAENQIGVRSLNQLSATTTCIRWPGSSRVINFWFGRLILEASSLESWQGRGNGETLQKAEFLETKATLIPARWLLRKGAVLKITRLVSAIVAPSIQCSLTPIMVISDDHEIVSAMQYGDLTRVQRLVLGGEVHPASIFPDGSSLLFCCIDEIYKRILPNRYIYDRYEKDDTLQALGPSQETFNTIYEMIDIALWLIAQGSAADTPNIYGKNAFNLLDKIYLDYLRVSEFLHENSNKLGPLVIAILQASESSPFFVRDPGCGQLKLTDIFISKWWYYLDILVPGTSSDISTTVCLTVLQSLWGRSPYNQNCKSIDCYSPEDVVPKLSKAAISGKLWLAGDDGETKRCLHMLYCSIRGALVHASPYNMYPDGAYLTGRRNKRTFYRSKIIDAIAEMLRYKKDVSTYEERPSLTDCAMTWRCLDIWKLALEKAGCQPLSPAIWNDYSHFYDPLGFVFPKSGASVSLTGDAISHKVILAVGERQYEYVEPNKRSGRKEFPRSPEFKELTKGWQCALKLPRVHCEVYPSRTIDTEMVIGETNQSPLTDRAEPASKYKLQPTEDGGIELFIDCCEVGEPRKRIWDEVKAEQDQDPDESKHDYPTSGDESSDSGDTGEDSNGASPGVFSKIAGFGLEVMSAIV